MPAPTFTAKPVRPQFMPGSQTEAIHQWLASALGAHPDEIIATDPAQNFRPVLDVEPLMRILGGPWLALVERCHAAKADMRDKRSGDRASHAGEAAEGSFGAVNGQKWRQVGEAPRAPAAEPTGERKVFDRVASIGTDLAGRAERANPIVDRNSEVIYPKGAQE
jgi:hypothetical protein